MARRRFVLAGVLAIGAMAIAVNALVLQSARHPAPLFAAVQAARLALLSVIGTETCTAAETVEAGAAT